MTVTNGFFRSSSERITPSAIISDAAGSMWVPSAMMRLPFLRIFSMPSFIRSILPRVWSMMARMKCSLLLLLCALPLYCGPVSFGLKAGVPVTAAEASYSDSRYSVDTQRWTAGGTVEIDLPANLSVGVDALYRRFSNSYHTNYIVTAFTDANIGHWEFPVYAKYRFGGHLAQPYVEAGFAFDRAHTSVTSGCSGGEYAPGEPLCGGAPASSTFSSSQWGAGFLAGGGVEIKAAFLKIAPEVRYTRWPRGVFSTGTLGRPNQVEILVGVRF